MNPPEPSARRDASPNNRPRVLLLTHRVPYPPDRGDRIRSWHVLSALAQHADISLACLSDAPLHREAAERIRKLTTQSAIQPITRFASAVRGGLAFAHGQAITPAWFSRDALRQKILAWHAEQPFDAIYVFCSGMISYLDGLLEGPKRPRVILDLVDVDSAKWADLAERAPWPLRTILRTEAQRLRGIEHDQGSRADALLLVTEAERRLYLERVGGGQPKVSPNGVDLQRFAPLPDCPGKTLAFVGVMNYWPNVEAADWFARKVLPRIRSRVPGANLKIIGRSPSRAVRNLRHLDGVTVTGPVEDVREHLRTATAVVAPLLTARGVQNKVLEAMACQRAVVCTPQAAQGIDAIEGQEILIARHADAWAEQIDLLLNDSPRRRTIAAAAYARVQALGSWNKALASLPNIVLGNEQHRPTRKAA
ncbi:TIGR03087 family PEP-CTERM/XrtA system glycosyltransferase [Mucisphaera sp.]|uniref:TIGR03087 family PEP-CTERM/XrtA system glycosyltransferase n=1 Tax=Mucisphaera sp. TaxID=2913024 RepID=UPI003D121468